MAKAVGLHVHSGRSNRQVEDYIRSAKPTVMKWLADGVDPRLVDLAKVYGALTILRVYEPDQLLGNPHEGNFLAKVEGTLQRYPQIDAHEGYNEAIQRLPDIRRRAEFDISLMQLCERYGRKAVIGSFSVGQPQWPATGAPDDWEGYLPALRHAAQRGHYVGLHEYGGPAMQWGVGENQMTGLVDGRWERIDPATRPGVKGWFCLRYRRVVEHWRALGLSTIPKIVITEAGLDDIQPRPNVGARRGYKTYRDTPYWKHPVLGDFAGQLRWQCERWAEDDYLVGGVIFGFADASGQWDDFDLSTDPESYARVVQEMNRLPEGAPPQPTPVPTPAPTPVPVPPPSLAKRYRPYVLRQGDTLWRVAGSRWREVLRVQPLGNTANLPVGTVIMIPVPDEG
jgi:hypothetical protein